MIYRGSPIDKITKLLALTTSTFDGEALNAIRAANEILNEQDKTWEEVIHPNYFSASAMALEIKMLKQEIAYLKEVKQPNKSITIAQKINVCLEAQPYNKFLNSISSSFPKYGRLTDRQSEVLEEIYASVV